ncbi:DNA-(apurinic or apyrimidinic site) endonuclease [Entamoeba marina]
MKRNVKQGGKKKVDPDDEDQPKKQTKISSYLYDQERDNDEFYKDYTKYEDPYKDNEPEVLPGEQKIVTFNVASWNAAMKKGLKEYIAKENPDILCIQETKLQENITPTVDGYHSYFSASVAKKGYAGTALLTKQKPISVSLLLNGKKNDEGRIITAEFDKFYLINTYVPNAGENLKFMEKRVDKWDKEIKIHLKELSSKKPVVWCGDLNVALRWVDLAIPKSRLRIAGFTKEERESAVGIADEVKLVDSFQHLHPKEKEFYTFFSFRDKSKTNGWRLDYFNVSESIIDSVTKIYRRKNVSCSDHVPLVIHLKI